MEKIVFESEMAVATYNEKTETYTLKYLPATEHMSDDDWKDLSRKLLVITDTYKPKYILDDNSERLYAYPPEIQAWTLELFLPTWTKNGLKKYVQILPKDFIGQLSGEQIVELAQFSFTDLFANCFVEDYESAVKWLNL